MRTIEVFRFDELSETARQKALENVRYDIAGKLWEWDYEDYRNSLDAFQNVTKCKARDAYVDTCRTYYRTDTDDMYEMGSSNNPMDAKQIKGKYLLRYLTNYILPELTELKSYRKQGRKRNSKILTSTDNEYALTGTYSDYSILSPIFDYIKDFANKQAITLHELMEECFYNFFKEWKNVYSNYVDSDEAIIDEMESGNYEFYSDGRLCNLLLKSYLLFK